MLNPRTIAVGSYDHKLYTYSISSGRVIDSIVAHDDAITCCEYLPSLNVLVSGSWDSVVKVWDERANKLKPMTCFEDHEEQITCMAKDWTGSQPYYIATADLDGKVIVRDMRAGDQHFLSSFNLGGPIRCLRLSQYSDHLVSILPERLVISEQNGAEVGSLPCYQVSCLATDGIFAVTGREEGELQIWETMKGGCVHQWSDIQGVTAVTSDLLGESIVAGTLEGMLYYISDLR